SGGTPMSRTSQPSWWSPKKRSKVGARGTHGPRRSPVPARRRWRHLDFEGLENRYLLSIAVKVQGSTVNFLSDALDDQLYLSTTSAGLLAYHDQNTSTFATDLGGASLSVTTQDVTIDTRILSSAAGGDGGVYLQKIATGGHSVTIQGDDSI